MRFDRELMKRKRGEFELSLRDLEKAMATHGSDISPQALSQWESGATTPGRVEDAAALALALGLELSDLFQPEGLPVPVPAANHSGGNGNGDKA